MRNFLTGTAIAVVSAAAFGLTAGVAHADPPDAFVKDAIQGNVAEVKMGELAQRNGGSNDVKSFGRTLVADHTKARDQSMSLAKSLKMSPPTEPSAEARDTYDKLAKLKGAAFDKEFAHHMVMDHQKDIAMYEDESKEKGSPAVSKYATDTLPTLRKHLQIAQSLDK
jgi:putative membrane protein